jgi:hypothetical protein
MINQQEYFATQGRLTAPGQHAALLDPLPRDIGALCRVVQGLMIHIFWADQYGLQLDDARRAEVQLRSVARQLARMAELDPRPLAEPREPAQRLVGNCRDFSTMLAAMLRHHGVPARARCGFARYFHRDQYEDHWVCEHWNADERRWVLVDAQLDAHQVGVLGLDFSPLDVPRSQFVTGGQAWALCRAGQADPDSFGVADLRGLWFIRGDLGRDVAALNKVELLPWDCWGIIDARDDELTDADMAALDHMAQLTSADVPDLDRVHALYAQDARWRVPTIIRSYTPAGPIEIDLDDL